MSDAMVPTGMRLRSLDEIERLAATLARAKTMVPRAFANDPAAIAAVILTGLELDMGPMEALRSIHMIEGKATLSAESMLARAMRRGVTVRWLRHDAQVASCEIERGGITHTWTFSMADAQRAGVTGKSVWKAYPDAMLRARCISSALRAICPDVLGAGVYTAEEIDETAPSTTATVIESSAPVETAPALPAETRRHTLDDCTTADDVAAWCSAHADRLASLAGERRSGAKAKIVAAAERTGADIMGALEAAGLLDAPAEEGA